MKEKWQVELNTFSPLARLMARSGRRTRKTRKIFTADIASELFEREENVKWLS